MYLDVQHVEAMYLLWYRSVHFVCVFEYKRLISFELRHICHCLIMLLAFSFLLKSHGILLGKGVSEEIFASLSTL